MKPSTVALTLALFAATAAQAQPNSTLAISQLKAKSASPLKVTSPAFKTGADIPFENTQYRGNVFPGLAWSPGPAGTRSYVVIMQDAEVPKAEGALVHWSMLRTPATLTKLEPGMTKPPAGAAFGPSMRGAAQPYAGPHTPPGPKHRYHFEVFALDTVLADPGKDIGGFLAAMKGHVLASGEVVGLGQADPTAKPAG